MTLIIVISLILIIFSVLWIFLWGWFFRLNNSAFIRLQEIGTKAFEKGNYKKAKELLIRALNKKGDFDLKLQLGISHLNLREYKEAQKVFEQLLIQKPDNENLILNLITTLIKQCQFQNALEICNEILTKKPDDASILIKKAEIYYAQNEIEKALETTQLVDNLSPENKDAGILKLKCKSEMHDPDNTEEYDEIIQELNGLIEKYGYPPEANLIFAKMYAKNGELESAVEACLNTITACPDDVEAYQLLGLTQLIQKDFASAKETLNKALELDKKNKETHNLYSYVLCQQVDNCPLDICREKYYKLIEKYIK